MTTDLICGRRPVFEVLKAGKRSVQKLWLAEGLRGGIVEDIVKLARERGAVVEFVQRGRIEQILRQASPETPLNHQGVLAQVAAIGFVELEDFLKQVPDPQPCLIVALDEIQDPHNVGAILRNAGFFGASAVIVPRWRNAPVGETVVRTSAGAIEHVTMIRVGNLVQSIDIAKEAGFEVLGADMAGEPAWTYVPHRRMMLIMGSEETGLRHLVREHCDKLLGIPRRSELDSLNVASASAALLYELTRPR